MKRIVTTGAAVALVLGVGHEPAFAGHIDAVLKAPVTPTQAVKIAESGGGHASATAWKPVSMGIGMKSVCCVAARSCCCASMPPPASCPVARRHTA